MTHSSLLGDLIDLNETLTEDLALDLEERKQRDREIGRELQDYRNKPVAQIRSWLHKLNRSDIHSNGLHGARLYHILCLVLLSAGLITGWALASAVLYYDGAQPINVVNAVVVLVLPQILLLLAWLLTVLPVRLPLIRNVGETLGFLNPGRLMGQLVGIFSRKEAPGLESLWNPNNSSTLAPVARWLFSFWSQLFAFSFNIGILLSIFFLVTFSDLAFVWSTTLNISNEHFRQLLEVFSAPWAAMLPDAVPGAELVDRSRFYRLEQGSLAGDMGRPQLAVELGQWWPFLILAVTFYGLLPRLLTLGISWYRFRHHMRMALCNLPGAPELLARMNSPLVSTLAKQPEQSLKLTGHIGIAPGETHYDISCPIIIWSSACANETEMDTALGTMGIEALDFLHAGGRQSIEQDRELLKLICARKPEGVGVVVKAWEPPMLDFLDFVRAVRRQCGQGKAVIVMLWGGQVEVSLADRETWQLTLNQLGDPDVHIEAMGQQA
jgi:hypothetical protein